MLKRLFIGCSATLLSLLALVIVFAPPQHEVTANAADAQESVKASTGGNLEQLSSLARSVEMLENAIKQLREENTRLKAENLATEESHEKLKQSGGRHFESPKLDDLAFPNEKKLSPLERQTSEVHFNRQLQVYDYKKQELHSFTWTVPYSAYNKYRSDHEIHGIPTLKGTESAKYYRQALSSWKELDGLAEGLRVYSGNDDELYANMVLQVTHQFVFMATDNTKHPIETFVEGTGDCDSLAVFAAALMKAGGLDSAIAYGLAKPLSPYDQAIGHAVIGVKLEKKLDDHGREGYTINGQGEYYIAEPTWEAGVFERPWDYHIPGSAVGDLVWKEFSGRVVETPD